jgi:hypothetical protein
MWNSRGIHVESMETSVSISNIELFAFETFRNRLITTWEVRRVQSSNHKFQLLDRLHMDVYLKCDNFLQTNVNLWKATRQNIAML